jgi:tripartite-type tricarboxylate transporter receptor subunit TctC
MNINRRHLFELMAASAVASSGLVFSSSAMSQSGDAAAFFRDKTVRLLVGSPPGGGYDLYARLIAPYLAKRLNCTVIIENRSGGGGLLALSYMLTRPADGLTIMLASAEAATLSQLLQREGVTWDVATLNWLARVGSAPKLWFVGKSGKFQTLEQLRAAPQVVWAATGPADNISDVAATISHVADLKSKIVVGYRGAGDMSLAVVRGEVDSGVLSADSALPRVRNGDLSPIAIFHKERWKPLPDVPTIFEAVKIDPAKKWIVDFRQNIGEAQRAMVAAPGTPEHIVAFLRQVMRDVLTDPALLAEGRSSNREIEFAPGEELQAGLVEMFKLGSTRRAELQKIMLRTYL